MDELETYQKKSNRKSVLLFPPLPSRLRYLIHKATEDLPEFTTFSVGENGHRRVVVCHSELRNEREDDSSLEKNSLCEDPVRSREPGSSFQQQSRRPKRPDKPLFTPRAVRERMSLQNPQGPTAYKELSNLASSSCTCPRGSSDSCFSHETTKFTSSSSTSSQESVPSVASGILNHIAESSVCPPEEELELRLHDAETLVWDQALSSFADMTLADYEKDKENLASGPYCTQTEDNSTDLDVVSEIKVHLKDTVSFSIEHVHNDFSIYENVCINPDEFRHVIEIYDFPSMLKTDDILDAFTEYSDGGMKIKWVDNTHALGVFSSESAALHALSICHPLLKVRPLAKGSKKSKGKAMRRAEFIQPVKERPRTDCAAARRMVTRALGLQGRGQVQRY